MPTARLWWCVTKNAAQELCTRVCGVWKARSAKCTQKRSSKSVFCRGESWDGLVRFPMHLEEAHIPKLVLVSQ